MGAAADSSLEAMRLALAPAIADAAAFDGWSEEAVRAAADQVGLDADAALFAFQGGAIDMIDAWIAAIDAEMAAAFTAEQLAAMKIRERIRSLVQFRLDTIGWQQEALRRALAMTASGSTSRPYCSSSFRISARARARAFLECRTIYCLSRRSRV